MAVTLAPPMAYFFPNPNNSGAPAAGFKLFSYQGGTSIKQATWTDSSQVTQWSNPIILDSNGAATIWGDPTLIYKFVWAPATDTDPPTSPIRTVDNFRFPITSDFTVTPNFPATPAELSAGVTITNFTYQPYDIRRYGGDPTGVTTSDLALAAALAVCGPTGGTIRFPNGLYTFANTYNCNLRTNIIFQGDGTANGGAQPATRLQYTGTVSPWITFTGSSGSGFRDLQLYMSNAGFTGTQVKFGNTGGADSTQCFLENCMFEAASPTGVTNVDLDKTICWSAYNCIFASGNPSISGQATGGASYSNQIAFRSCQWVSSLGAAIFNGGTAWVVDACTFEPQNKSNSPPAGFLSANSATQFLGLVVTGCWFGDTGTASGAWFDISGQGIDIRGNYITGNQTGTTAFHFRGVVGAEIACNIFLGLLTILDFPSGTNDQIVVQGNIAGGSITNVWTNTSNVILGTLVSGPNFGFGVPPNHGSLATTGYHVNADGTIEQWGVATSLSNGSNTVNFPVTFPNAVFNIQISLAATLAASATVYISTITTLHFLINLVDAGASTDTMHWRAIGN